MGRNDHLDDTELENLPPEAFSLQDLKADFRVLKNSQSSN